MNQLIPAFFVGDEYFIDEKVSFLKFTNEYKVYNERGTNIGVIKQRMNGWHKIFTLLVNKTMLPPEYASFLGFDLNGNLDLTLLNSAKLQNNMPQSDIYDALLYVSTKPNFNINVYISLNWLVTLKLIHLDKFTPIKILLVFPMMELP